MLKTRPRERFSKNISKVVSSRNILHFNIKSFHTFMDIVIMNVNMLASCMVRGIIGENMSTIVIMKKECWGAGEETKFPEKLAKPHCILRGFTESNVLSIGSRACHSFLVPR